MRSCSVPRALTTMIGVPIPSSRAPLDHAPAVDSGSIRSRTQTSGRSKRSRVETELPARDPQRVEARGAQMVVSYEPDAARARPERKETAEAMASGTSLEISSEGAERSCSEFWDWVGYYPSSFAAIGAIGIGGGLMAHGIAAAARWRDVARASGEQHTAQAGVGAETVGGAAGAALGILSLLGVLPMILLPVSAIVLGVTLAFAAPHSRA